MLILLHAKLVPIRAVWISSTMAFFEAWYSIYLQKFNGTEQEVCVFGVSDFNFLI